MVMEGNEASYNIMQVVESVSVPEESKGGLFLASKEEGKDREKKDIIIYQGIEDNLVSSRVGDERVLENDVMEMENLDEWEDLPSTPKNSLIVSRSLDIELEREVSLSPKAKKKYVREPSMASPVETRSSNKLDVGTMARRGRRSENKAREEETRRCLVNGHQRTLLECSKNGK